MLPGGVSDKLGNGYEALWAVRQALRVLRGNDARSLKIEPIGVGKGFEFFIDALAGREWHQSKRRGASGNWTLGALNGEGFFLDVVREASSDASARFTFVSIDPASDLATLVDKARLVESFGDFKSSLTAGQAQKFSSIAGYFKLDEINSWDLLRRIFIEVRSEHGLREDIRTEFGIFFHGDPEDGILNLKSKLDDGLTQTLSTDRLRQELLASGFRMRDAMLDPTVPQRLDDQNQTYLQSHGPLGADGVAIVRRESAAIADVLADSSIKVVVVTGVAGGGKSGVLRQTADLLSARGATCLLTRIDRLLHVPTASALGAQIFGREESPCRTLSMLAGENAAVLFVDQLDAVSEISGRQSAAKDLIFALLKGADLLPNLKLVLSCRAYDFDNDRRFSALLQTDSCKRIAVGALHFDDDVAPYLAQIGIDPETVSSDQRELLSLPVNLMLYVQLRRLRSADLTAARTRTELFALLLCERNRELVERGVSWTAEAALGAIAVWMSEHERFDAPDACLDGYAGAVASLVSANLLARDGNHLRFFHESLFDYIFARTFVASGISLTDWLIGSEQILFRRTQVRQALELLRADDPMTFRRELERLLTDTAVRVHIKDMVARWIASLAAPDKACLDIVLKLDSPGAPPLLVRHALGGAAWVRLLAHEAVIEKWLEDSVAERRSFALWLLDSGSKDDPAIVADCLRAWWRRSPERYAEILRWMSMPNSGPAVTPLEQLYLELIGKFPEEGLPKDRLPEEADIGFWVHKKCEGAPALYGAWLGRWFEGVESGHPFEQRSVNQNVGHWVKELAKEQPREYAAAVAPYLARAFERETAAGRSTKRYTSAFRARKQDEGDYSYEVMDLMRAALKSVAASDPSAARRILLPIDPTSHTSAMHLYLETISANCVLADVLEPLIGAPSFFEAGFEGPRWRSAAEALRVCLPKLSDAALLNLEARFAALRPELDFASQLIRSDRYGAAIDERRADTLRALQSSGEDLWSILKTIGADKLPIKWQHRLSELDRKFPGGIPDQPRAIRVGWVRSPISVERAKRMDDRNWLNAIKKYRSNAERRGWDADGPVGGADQLAHLMQEECKANPDRFAKLAGSFPAGTYPRYFSAIAEGVGQSEAPSTETVIATAHLVIAQSWSSERNPLPQLIERKPCGLTDKKVWEELVRLTKDGGEGQGGAGDEDESKVDDEAEIEIALDGPSKIWFKGAISERGGAIEAIGAGASEIPTLLEPTSSLVRELSALSLATPIRCCLVRPVHAVAAVDPDRGLDQLEEITRTDALPLGTQRGIQLVTWALFRRENKGWPLVRRVLASADAGVRRTGMWMLGQFAHEDAAAAEEFEGMWAASSLARRIAARVAVGHAQQVDRALVPRTTAWLRQFFADPDEKVRREAASFGRCLSGPDRVSRGELAEVLANSEAFRTDPDDLLHGLEGRGAEFPRVVIASAKAYFSAQQDEAFRERRRKGAGAHWLAKTILSAYRHLESEPIYRRDALDIIDQLVEHDQFGTRAMLDDYERH